MTHTELNKERNNTTENNFRHFFPASDCREEWDFLSRTRTSGETHCSGETRDALRGCKTLVTRNNGGKGDEQKQIETEADSKGGRRGIERPAWSFGCCCLSYVDPCELCPRVEEPVGGWSVFTISSGCTGALGARLCSGKIYKGALDSLCGAGTIVRNLR